MSMCSTLLSCVFVAFPQSHCSRGILLVWRITFQDCTAETSTHCGPVTRHFPTILDQNAIFDGKVPYANPELDMENIMKNISKTKGRGRASFASYCSEKVNNKGHWRTGQKVNTKKCISGNERMWVWIRWNRCAKQKRWWEKAWDYCMEQSKSITRETAAQKQNDNANKDLELLRVTKGSESEDKGNRGENKIPTLEKAWNYHVEQKELSRKTKETAA